MLTGEWGGTMCLTEPQAGSSLSDIVTKATPDANNAYKISGQKYLYQEGSSVRREYSSSFTSQNRRSSCWDKRNIIICSTKNRLNDNGELEANDVTTVADFEKWVKKVIVLLI
ncbi:MAG: hypothetical protein CM15mP109_05380 [Candidatus Dadabacteria bacterium]|nr:MAG: hypothetical protein CM15mP109_05380 [Candidatus Dadabacteria bacterium]